MSFKNIQKITDKILHVLIVVLFIVMFGVTTLNVILRYIFNNPLSYSVELGRYTFCGIIYLGAILVMRENGHIGLDILVDMFPEKIKNFVKKLTRVMVLIYLAIFCYYSYQMVISNWATKSSSLGISMSFVYMFLVIGSLGMFIESFLILMGYTGGED